MDSSFRRRDADLVKSLGSAQALRAWVPAFAGMTVFDLISAPCEREAPDAEACWSAAARFTQFRHPLHAP
ncbi:hypothetical protein DX912_11830 [Lysobacter soli]|uniref:Uncharacterized protein n=1 Tax=Lysobacter soli TaxID=453783 RepID=A0A3D8VD63_9GAMM|nr:hypothetical protein DX912_11830 [Lysobacter soli]